MTKDFLLVWLMPWAEFSETLSFGNVEIWDFYREGPLRITSGQKMLWLAQFISCFKNRDGIEMKNVGVLQASPVPFQGLGPYGNYRVRWAADAIAFAFLVSAMKNNLDKSTPIGNSERFQLVQVLIDSEGLLHYSRPGSEGISDIAGKYVLFHEPPQNGIKVDCADPLLLKGLGKVNDTQAGSELWRKLRRCFEWFSSAWTLSDDVSGGGRFVSTMTAFETLTRERFSDTAPILAERAATICGWSSLPKTEEISKGKKTLQVSKPERFICDFAKYRNSFVHGDVLPWGFIKHVVGSASFDPRHVMSLVIYCLVVRLLIDAGIWDDLEKQTMQKNIDSAIDSLGWGNLEKLGASPHIGYGGSPHDKYF